MLSSGGGILWLSHLIIDLREGLIGKDEGGIQGNGLLGSFQSFFVAFHFTVGIGKIVIVVSIDGSLSMAFW